MKQLGNLAIVCAQRPEVLMQIHGGIVTVHVGCGPERGENDQLVRIKTSNMYDDWDSEFERDDEGNIVTWKNLSAAEGVIASKYKYQTFDEQGNWTKLSEGSEVTTRKLTYWK